MLVVKLLTLSRKIHTSSRVFPDSANKIRFPILPNGPNLTLLFNYNFLVVLVDEEFMVCPTTFIMKILKFRGTSGY